MTHCLFLGGLAAFITVVLGWSFRHLPRERWQILATVPVGQPTDDLWQGRNLTFYGVFNACAYTFGIAMFMLLLAAAGIALPMIVGVLTSLLIPCMIASRQVARRVEQKQNTFSVGAASFVGLVMAPWVLWLINAAFGWTGFHLPPLLVLAALAVAYGFGEGLGRLACISFGCCYGKPLTALSPAMQKFWRPVCFSFTGKTKKIAYAHGLDGQKVLPVQAMTSVLYCLSGLAGSCLFLRESYPAAFLFPLIVTQLWRFFSEFLRADYRGGGRISAYQVMSLAAILYALALVPFVPKPLAAPPDILKGLNALWHPAVILFLELVWIGAFWYTGRSQSTAAMIFFHVQADKV